ncbi:MAG: biopolymer transporter ExbD [Leptospirales bacterium]|jgi:biopolymer transport protein ExbD
MAFRVKRKGREVEEIPLASTSDIAFLLIVFFLAASALLELRGVQMPLPVKDAPPMQILKENVFKIGIAPDGGFSHDGTPYELPELGDIVAEQFKANSELVVVVRAHAEAPSRAIPEIVKLLQDLQIVRVSIGMDPKSAGQQR